MATMSVSRNLNTVSVALLYAAVAASFLPGSPAAGTSSLVSRTCRRTFDERLCLSILGSDIRRSAAATTVQELAVVALGAAGNAARDAGRRATRLSAGARRGTPERDLLAQCAALYAECESATAEAAREVSAARYDDAHDASSVFHGYPEKCDWLFYTRGLAMPMEKTNREMQEKLGVAKDLVDMLYRNRV
ncbi:hypothetical protein ACP70R_028254 [Stipagrostis hirtigluma subsp. patula]